MKEIARARELILDCMVLNKVDMACGLSAMIGILTDSSRSVTLRERFGEAMMGFLEEAEKEE